MLEINNLIIKLKEQKKISKNAWYTFDKEGIKFENIHFRSNEFRTAKQRLEIYLKNVERS